MYWGSGGDIVTARLAPGLSRLARPGLEPETLLRGWSAQIHRPYEHGIEGPYVVTRDGWYYLFYLREPLLLLPAALRNHGCPFAACGRALPPTGSDETWPEQRHPAFR